MPLATIEEAVEAYARGEFLVVVDDEDRENEGSDHSCRRNDYGKMNFYDSLHQWSYLRPNVR